MLMRSQRNAHDGRGRGDACVAPTVSGPRGRVFDQREMSLAGSAPSLPPARAIAYPLRPGIGVASGVPCGFRQPDHTDGHQRRTGTNREVQ